MHLTQKKETTKPAASNILQQQGKFDEFVDEFNNERPHQALEMKTPSEVYKPSNRIYRGLPPLEYPFHDRTITVTHCGRVCMGRRVESMNLLRRLFARLHFAFPNLLEEVGRALRHRPTEAFNFAGSSIRFDDNPLSNIDIKVF